MLDKSKLGTRFVCFSCGCKFYDLNRPEALCPDCGTDQAGAPARDIRALLANKGFLPSGFAAEPDKPEEKPETKDEDADVEEEEEEEEDEELLSYDSAAGDESEEKSESE